jgi:arsenite methyltransferase
MIRIDLKTYVKDKYSAIADSQGCGCGTGCCGGIEFSMIGDEYSNVQGHVQEADLGLGCGIPTEFANLKKGDRVLDLGSGAGNDCFVARSIVGSEGYVTGLDFSQAMIKKARENAMKLGYDNMEFIEGDIEEMPLKSSSYDVILSNCVLNLVPDKEKAFAQILRVLKPGGHFCISDVVLQGDLPSALVREAEMYAGCVSGALKYEEYLQIINDAGFIHLDVPKIRTIELPENLLLKYLTHQEFENFKKSASGIKSITVYAQKPA